MKGRNNLTKMPEIFKQLHKVVLVIVSAGLTACAGSQTLVYPDHLDMFRQARPAEVTEHTITAEIDAPADKTWDALLFVLNQYALVGYIDRSNPAHREIDYSDVTSLLIEKQPMTLMLPFQVIVEPVGMTASRIIVYCRWDLIDNKNKARNSSERLVDLKSGMDTEGYVLANRVATEVTGGKQWKWLGSEGQASPQLADQAHEQQDRDEK